MEPYLARPGRLYVRYWKEAARAKENISHIPDPIQITLERVDE
jgi:hypothetical protein